MRGCHSGAVCSSYVITFWFFLALYFWFEWARAIRWAIVRILGGARLDAPRASLRRHGNRSPQRQPTLTHQSQPLGLWWKRSRAGRRTGRGVNRRANAKCSDTHSIRSHSMHATVTRNESKQCGI